MMMLMQDTDYIDVIWDLHMNFVRLNQLIYKKSPQYLWELRGIFLYFLMSSAEEEDDDLGREDAEEHGQRIYCRVA
jgi:hypothetical protein